MFNIALLYGFADSWTMKEGNLCKADGNLKHSIKQLHVAGNFRCYSVRNFMAFVTRKININLKYCNLCHSTG